MPLVYSKKIFTLLYFGTYLKEELTDCCFVWKGTRVFPIATQAKQTEDVDHFAND